MGKSKTHEASSIEAKKNNLSEKEILQNEELESNNDEQENFDSSKDSKNILIYGAEHEDVIDGAYLGIKIVENGQFNIDGEEGIKNVKLFEEIWKKAKQL